MSSCHDEVLRDDRSSTVVHIVAAILKDLDLDSPG